MERLSKRGWRLLLLILLAGCTTVSSPFSSGTGADGLPTTGLSTTFRQLGSFALETEAVTLEIDAENVGQADATGISATLHGPSFVAGKTVSLGSLDGADRAAGQSGGTAVETVQVPAPQVEPGTAEQFDVSATVSYDYRTGVSLPIRLSPQAFTRSQSQITSDNTAGPIRIRSTASTPIATGSATSHPIPLVIENVGEGELVSPVSMTPSLIDPPSGVSLDCGGGTVSISVSGQATTTCTLTTPSGGVPFQTTVTLQVDAGYRYSQEESATVTVRGVN